MSKSLSNSFFLRLEPKSLRNSLSFKYCTYEYVQCPNFLNKQICLLLDFKYLIMNQEIGLGIILGLIVGVISLIFKNNYFSNNEKIWLSLLTFFIFPIGIPATIIMYLIARRKPKNEVYIKLESLNKLHKKGLVSKKELDEKLIPIKNELQNKAFEEDSTYRSLIKSFNSGLFTKEEFDEKVKEVKENFKFDSKSFVSDKLYSYNFSKIFKVIGVIVLVYLMLVLIKFIYNYI